MKIKRKILGFDPSNGISHGKGLCENHALVHQDHARERVHQRTTSSFPSGSSQFRQLVAIFDKPDSRKVP